MADIAKMIEEIKGMTVMELNSLVKAIEEEFGVSAAAPLAFAGGRKLTGADGLPVVLPRHWTGFPVRDHRILHR